MGFFGISSGFYFHKLKHIAYLYIAKGSLCELEYYRNLAKRLGYLSDVNYQRLDALQDETAKVLTGFIRFKQKEAESQAV
ncbi:four helix bundle protein [bacterium]|nr:four helix bundle protein [bacterium]